MNRNITNLRVNSNIKKKKYKIDKKEVFGIALVTSAFAVFAFTGEPMRSLGERNMPVISPLANTFSVTREDIMRNMNDTTQYDIPSSNESEKLKDIDSIRSDYGNDQIQGVLEGGCLDGSYVLCQNPYDGGSNGYDYFYLNHDEHGNRNTSGSFFLSSTSIVNDDNISKIYAHNFHHGTSFLSGAYNYNDPNYYKEHPTFTLYMDGITYELDVVGYTIEDPSLIDENISNSNLLKKINNVESNSPFKSEFNINSDSKYICFITCTPEGGANTNNREIIWCQIKTLTKVKNKTL